MPNFINSRLTETVNRGLPVVQKFSGVNTEEGGGVIPYSAPMYATSSTIANVASSASSVTLLAANTNRKGVIITNDSTAILYITLNASAASTTNYSVARPPIDSNGVPSFFTLKGDDYAGEIRGIWASANGFARITELF